MRWSPMFANSLALSRQFTNRGKQTMQTKTNKTWTPPRGIRFVQFPDRPAQPHGVQWRVNGARKTKTFESREAQIDFAKSLAGAAQAGGVEALTLDSNDARAWRAFRVEIGDASLEQVIACWKRHGKAVESITVRQGIAKYLEAKKAEAMDHSTFLHYVNALDRLSAAMGNDMISSVQREAIIAWSASLNFSPETKKTHLRRALGFFTWLKINRFISENPCDGVRLPKIIAKEIETLTLQQGRDLFDKNKDQPRELLGRLALEAFVGLRFASVQKMVPDDISFVNRGINLPAAKLKTRRRQFIDGLPDNLWTWLNKSDVEKWSMTPRQYLTAKSNAMIRAGISVHNGLRHSFATYHVAAHKDVSRTSVILCHSSPKMLWSHYKGRATEVDGKAWFEIVPN